MIDRLSGHLLAVRPHSVVVRPGEPDRIPGIEVELHVPVYWAEALASDVGRPFAAHTRLVLESQNQGAAFTPRLLGFPSEADRAFFELFTSVKGLGQRKALKALAMDPPVIAAAITARDAKALQKLPEIGKRLAETIIAELHGKLGSIAVTGQMGDGSAGGVARPFAEPKPVASGPAEDAVAALVALGQTRADAEAAVARALASLAADASPAADELVALAFAHR